MTIHWSTCKVHKRSAPNFEGSPYPGQPPAPHSLLCTARAAPFNLTVISHLAAVAVVRVGFFFFPAKVVGGLVNVTEGFHFFYTKEMTQAPEGRAGPWEVFLGPVPLPRPGCARHAALLTSASSWASRKRPRRGNLSQPDSPPIRGPDSSPEVSDTGGLVQLRGPG